MVTQRRLDAGHRADLARDALGDELRRFEAGALRRADVHLELRLVVLGQEALGDDLHRAGPRAEREHRRGDHDPAVAHHPGEGAHVGALDRPVDDVDDPLEEQLLGRCFALAVVPTDEPA